MIADIGIDLGTSSILVYVRGKGVIIKEPSLVAFDKDSNTVKAIGEEARQLLARTAGNVVPMRPLLHGTISDYSVTEKVLKYFVQKAMGKRMLKKPFMSICIPSQVTEVEKKAVEEAAYAAGARSISLVEEPVAAAIGAGIDISKPAGSMVVDIGGGTTDIAVISLGGTVASKSLRVAGDDFDEAIIRYIKKEHHMLIGDKTAEHIKIHAGAVYPLIEEEVIEIRGRSLDTGLPKQVSVSSREIEGALHEVTEELIQSVVGVLEKTPPELCADILERGILLTGGGALLRGLEELIQERTGVNTIVADDPMKVVAIGTGRYEEVIGGRRQPR
ncbi:rod shape-determining protein [Suipraeoptans intestinalis]|uniref:rod shape-determining protein n=1 Tax=Suipraeoptans intestinalis TaxID=2606628 RepID=UPI0023F31CF6|nr:rod shape-determining protein [Suipraeoptans intestinalis]MDD7770219.1 rod shape-determining protein [Suipraeoptans intestinalis]MDY3122719.1 rod shape-determining protein [Suipraeoptans intestinalis]